MIRQFTKLKRVSKYLEKNLKKYLIDIGKEVFLEAQATCPVGSGRLKASAEFVITPYGWNIKYNAPYAMEVHKGINGTLRPNPWTSDVREHKRDKSRKLHTVQQHRRVQKRNVKPIKISGLGWRNIDVSKPMKANPWLERAYQKVLQKQDASIKKFLPISIVT